MHIDLKLKELYTSIQRKELAKADAEGGAETYFELEIERLMDEFQARCLAVLAVALQMNDYPSLLRFFELIEASVPAEFASKVYSNLFKVLIKDVVFRANTFTRESIIGQLELFDESSEE